MGRQEATGNLTQPGECGPAEFSNAKPLSEVVKPLKERSAGLYVLAANFEMRRLIADGEALAGNGTLVQRSTLRVLCVFCALCKTRALWENSGLHDT